MLEGADEGLRKLAEHVLGHSQRIVLLDEGTLAASGHLEPERGTRRVGRTAEVDVVYDEVYARRRHEEVDVTPSQPGRQPKFVEVPLKEMASGGRFERVLGLATQAHMRRVGAL